MFAPCAAVCILSAQLWVAFSTSANEDRDFATRAGVNAAAILVFVNATIMVAFYMWIIQVDAPARNAGDFRSNGAGVFLLLCFVGVLTAVPC